MPRVVNNSVALAALDSLQVIAGMQVVATGVPARATIISPFGCESQGGGELMLNISNRVALYHATINHCELGNVADLRPLPFGLPQEP